MNTLAKTLNLGLNDRVVITNPILPDGQNGTIDCISGTVFAIDCLLENTVDGEERYTHDIYIQCADLEDYKKIIQNQNERLVYCNIDGKLQKSVIYEINGEDHFHIMPHCNSDLCDDLGVTCSYHDIWAILISTKTFTIVPVHAINHASKRYTINL